MELTGTHFCFYFAFKLNLMKEKLIILSEQDLEDVMQKVLTAIEALNNNAKQSRLEYMRSREVMEELGISSSLLQTLRVNKLIPYSKIGDTYFYPRFEIEKILIDNLVTAA